jgi:hypothetical protein
MTPVAGRYPAQFRRLRLLIIYVQVAMNSESESPAEDAHLDQPAGLLKSRLGDAAPLTRSCMFKLAVVHTVTFNAALRIKAAWKSLSFY